MLTDMEESIPQLLLWDGRSHIKTQIKMVAHFINHNELSKVTFVCNKKEYLADSKIISINVLMIFFVYPFT